MGFYETRDRLQAVDDQIVALDQRYAGKKMPEQARSEWNRLNAERDELDELRKREMRTYAIRHVNNPDASEGIGGGPGEVSRRRSSGLRHVESLERAGRLPTEAADKVARLVDDTGTEFGRSLAAKWADAAGDPAYESAFVKLLADPARGHLLWSEAERAAYAAGQRVRSEFRALSVSGADGGQHMVPLTLDPSILLTSDGSVDPLRRICRNVQTTTNSWQGVTSAGATAEWKAEGVEAGDGTPDLADAPIPVHLGDVYVEFSYEVGQDALNFVNELRRVMLDEADQLHVAAHMNGSGTGQPLGLTTALPAGSKVATGAADTLTADDVVGLQNALPPRFQPRAQWLANLSTINSIGSFETTNGALRFPEVGNDRLLRKPLNEASALDSVGDTAAAGNDNVAVYLDPSEFVIVTRTGATVELIPNVIGANRRPTGQRGLFLWFRSGSGMPVTNAARMLTA